MSSTCLQSIIISYWYWWIVVVSQHWRHLLLNWAHIHIRGGEIIKLSNHRTPLFPLSAIVPMSSTTTTPSTGHFTTSQDLSCVNKHSLITAGYAKANSYTTTITTWWDCCIIGRIRNSSRLREGTSRSIPNMMIVKPSSSWWTTTFKQHHSSNNGIGRNNDLAHVPGSR